MIETLASRHDAAAAAAEIMAHAISRGLATRGTACAALSGGSTPRAAYENLAARAMDWPHVTLLQVDERCVPAGGPGLNADMLRRALAPAMAKGAEFAPLWHGDQDPAHAAARADALYRDDDLDVALIGMGLDGHTASWFPGSPDLHRALDPQTRACVIAVEAPGAEAAKARLTMTLQALLKANVLALLIHGADKRAKLEHALAHESAETAPIVAILRARPDCSILWAA